MPILDLKELNKSFSPWKKMHYFTKQTIVSNDWYAIILPFVQFET